MHTPCLDGQSHTQIVFSGIAVAGGCVAILTALLPVVMQGGEDAFNEMKEEDADTWGSGNAGRLNKRR